MHELAIAMSLVEQAEKVAREQHAVAIPRISVRVGQLSGVDPEALRGAFPLAAEGTPAEGAELVVEVIEARVHCRACGHSSTPSAPFIYCVECRSTEVDVEAGRELYIKSVELDVEEGESPKPAMPEPP
jgi:hydrogenase nickel incorporation protein HypA/HybF